MSNEEYLSPHFREAEFTCNHCGKLHPNGVPTDLLDLLERARSHFGVPITVTSGYRCSVHNSNVGGKSNSLHLEGCAVDVQVMNIHPNLVYDWFDNEVGEGGGVGSYDAFTHVDLRGYKARW